MKTSDALVGYGALSTDLRMSILKLLSRSGPKGLASGDIARKLDVPASSLSTQLSLLSAAGLVLQMREGRNVFYRVNFEGLRSLIKFLAHDCGAGHVEGVRISG